MYPDIICPCREPKEYILQCVPSHKYRWSCPSVHKTEETVHRKYSTAQAEFKKPAE